MPEALRAKSRGQSRFERESEGLPEDELKQRREKREGEESL